MRFGERVRDLRTSKGLSEGAIGKQIEVSLTYVSKIEDAKLDFGDYPSEVLICRLADALEADPDELLLLARKIPNRFDGGSSSVPRFSGRSLSVTTARSIVSWRISVVMDRSPAKSEEKPADQGETRLATGAVNRAYCPVEGLRNRSRVAIEDIGLR